jgi:crossover junction endodeoxyribonuclease RuvC
MKDKQMRLLSVDPGLINTGWAVLEYSPKPESYTLKKCGVISPNPKWPIPKRLKTIHDGINDIVIEFDITHIALETPYLGKNAQSFLKLGYIRGLLLLISEVHALTVFEYAPQVVKKAISGYGYTDKPAIALLLKRLMPGLQMPEKYDITDAIAVGVCAFRLNGSVWRSSLLNHMVASTVVTGHKKR